MGAPAPRNSEVRKVAEDTLAALKYSFSAALAKPNARVRPGSLEEVFQQQFAKLPAEQLARHRKTAAELIDLPEAGRVKMFDRYGALSAEEFLSAGMERASEMVKTPLKLDSKLLGAKIPSIAIRPGMSVVPDGNDVRITGMSALRPELISRDFESARRDVVEHAASEGVFNEQRLSEIWGPVGDESNLVDPDEFEGQDFLDKLTFKIERVKCVDETNVEWPGSDEIALAGISVDETGDTKKISEKKIGGGFDDGDQKSYNPDWNYHWFNVREEMVANQWPKKYSITLLLAEKDHGGLSDALNQAWAKVKKAVKDKISDAVAGALTGYLGPVIAKAIGEAVAWIVDVFVGWIISLFKDDIFPPVNCWMNHAGPYARWSINGVWGSTRSPTLRAHFYGHGGHYFIDYHWQLHK
jgi:hypothetical protein